MKKLLLLLFISMLSASSSWAQFVCANCSDELTTLIQLIAQIDQGATQALQYENQILQYETMLRNMQQNPMAGVLPNYGLLVTNAIQIQRQGVSLANNMGDVSANLQKSFKTPQPNFGSQYALWVSSLQNASQVAMLNAGLQRQNLQPGGVDQAQLQALVNKNMASGGNLAALQTLGEFMAAQLQESQKLRDLISSQQQATNTEMMYRSSESQAAQTQYQVVTQPDPNPIPSAYLQGNVQVKTWNLYPSNK
ncbi:P-type conjugative transfer protein TrbJ [Oxalobacteraceae bacterium GrIS 1.18]